MGGRDIAAGDKAALDVWYVRKANLKLDAAIALCTIPAVLLGETVSVARIEQAWRELGEDGILNRTLITEMKRA